MISRRAKVSPTRPRRRSEWKRWPSIADDAGRLLAAVLQGVQAERGDGGGIGVAEDAEHAAFLAQPVAVEVRVGIRVAVESSSRRTGPSVAFDRIGLHRLSVGRARPANPA